MEHYTENIGTILERAASTEVVTRTPGSSRLRLTAAVFDEFLSVSLAQRSLHGRPVVAGNLDRAVVVQSNAAGRASATSLACSLASVVAFPTLSTRKAVG